MSGTVVTIDEWNGKRIFKIRSRVDDGTGAVYHTAVVSFGIRKAEAILNHLKELQQFVEDHNSGVKPQVNCEMDLTSKEN